MTCCCHLPLCVKNIVFTVTSAITNDVAVSESATVESTITSAILPTTIVVGVASTIAFAVVPTIDAIAVNRY